MPSFSYAAPFCSHAACLYGNSSAGGASAAAIFRRRKKQARRALRQSEKNRAAISQRSCETPSQRLSSIYTPENKEILFFIFTPFPSSFPQETHEKTKPEHTSGRKEAKTGGIRYALITKPEPRTRAGYALHARGNAGRSRACAARLEWHIAQKTDALVVCGTTGEASTMAEYEQTAALRAVVETAQGRVPVLAGVGGNDTKKVIAACRRAAREGAAGALAVTPYYNKTTQGRADRALYRRRRRLAPSRRLLQRPRPHGTEPAAGNDGRALAARKHRGVERERRAGDGAGDGNAPPVRSGFRRLFRLRRTDAAPSCLRRRGRDLDGGERRSRPDARALCAKRLAGDLAEARGRSSLRSPN